MGHYDESLSLWQEVARRNANLPMAYRSIGKIYYMSGEYMQAMEQFRLCEDRDSYSQAYREVRKTFVRENLLWLLAGVLAAVVVLNRLIHWFLIYTGARPRRERRRGRRG